MSPSPKTRQARKARVRRSDRPNMRVDIFEGIDTPDDVSVEELFAQNSIWLAAIKIRDSAWIEPSELADAIEANPARPLPHEVRDLVCRYLRGEVRPPRGRKPKSSAREFAETTAAIWYPLLLGTLRKENPGQGNRGDTENARHRRAIEIIQRFFKPLRGLSAERVANIISARRQELHGKSPI